MLPLKRAFVDISSADQSDSSMIFAPELRHRDPTTSFVASKTDPLLPSICLGMVSSGLGFRSCSVGVCSQITHLQISVDVDAYVAHDKLTLF